MLFHKNKCIVIAGCGPLGAALAKSLYKKGHKVVVLDKDRESFRYLPGMRWKGTQRIPRS